MDESEFHNLLTQAREQLASDPNEAAQLAANAAVLAEQDGDWLGCAQAERVSGQAFRVLGNHADAAEALGRAAEFATRGGNPLLAAQVQIGLVDSLGWLGRYDDALTLAKRLESQLEALGATEDAAKVLVNRGSLLLRRDQFTEALSCYERAEILLATLEDKTALARVQFNRATTLMELNRMEDALALFEAARETFAAQDMTTILAMIDANRGFLYGLSGRPASAVAALTRAREEFAAKGQNLEAAKCDADMADAYHELNLHPEALECYERAIGHFASVGIVYERARAQAGRAGVLMASQRDEDALEALEQAEQLFRSHRNGARLAHVRLLRASLLRRQGLHTEGQDEARRAALALARKGRHGWAAEARFLALDWETEMPGVTDAQTLRALAGIRQTARKWARGWLECRVEQAMGQLHGRRGNRGKALRHFRAGVALLEQARTEIVPETLHVAYLRDKLSLYEDMVAALLERGRSRDIAEALEYVERAKSRLLMERVQQTLEGRALDSDLPAPAQERLANLRAELSRIYHQMHALDDSEARRLGNATVEAGAQLSAVEEAYRKALHEIEVSSPSQTASQSMTMPAVPAASELQAALLPNEILVEFSVVHGKVCAFVVTSKGIHLRRSLASVDDVRHVSRRLRYQLERASWANAAHTQHHAPRFLSAVQDVLANCYDLLLRPLEDLLTAEKLVLIPHGDLHGLPFHAFWDGERSALDRWEWVFAPSAAFWHANRRRKDSVGTRGTAERALLVGIPEPSIERVAEEVEILSELLPRADVLCYEDATLQTVQSKAPHCHLFHIATHALYRADNPLFSGLKLADGWLLARDLYSMTLNCDLATLSACQTATAFVDAGDEVFGLVRGFLSAGARSVAASLWSADDAATAELMEPFYARLMQGDSPASALRLAQQALRKKFPHPYHWAAFALFGERGSTAALDR